MSNADLIAKMSAAKVIHIIELVGNGAIEGWLLRSLRVARSKNIPVDWTFYCSSGEAGSEAEAAVQLGARIVRSPVGLHQKVRFIKALREELRAGQYDVMHCHHDLVSSVYLLSALGLPIRRRFVQVHNAANHLPTSSGLKKAIGEPLCRFICLLLSDRIIGVSNAALDQFLKGYQRDEQRDIVHYCGVDINPFEKTDVDRERFRKQFGLGSDSSIILFAGRLVPEKNPLFALDVMQELVKRGTKVAGLFVGSGGLDSELARRIRERGLADSIFFTGWREDVPLIMRCCDCYVHTGPETPPEGFGLAVLEAQLAGLRLLVSMGVGEDALLPGAVVHQLPVSAGSAIWADSAAKLLQRPPPDRSEMLYACRGSALDIEAALPRLVALYSN